MNSSHFRDLFNRHDLRWTKQREEVYAALAGSTSHPTAEELFRLVHAGEQTADSAAGAGRPGGNGISLATVYNTLEALVRCGLARRYPAAGNSAAGSDAPHGTGPGGAVGSGGGGGAGGGEGAAGAIGTTRT